MKLPTVLFLLLTSTHVQAAQNVVLFEFDDVSPYQIQITPTPNIDSLAKMGVSFTQAHATASVCRPSRAGTQTGVYQQRFGIFRNPPENDRTPSEDPSPLPSSAVTMAEMLRGSGYKTAFFGKWHLGYSNQLSPAAQGASDGSWYLGGGHAYYGGGLLTPKGIDQPKGNLTEYLGSKAATYIRANKGKKWMVQVQMPAGHEPLQSDPAQMAACGAFTGARKVMCGMIRGGDNAVGMVMKALRDTGQINTTTVIVTSDQGCASGQVCQTGNLRGVKGTVWEGGMRVPLIVYAPGKLQGGKERRDVVSLLDIAPTVLSVTGARPQRPLDGISLFNPKPNRTLFFAPDPGRVSALRWPYKLYFEKKVWQLYNLAQDPSETRDIAKAYPLVVNSLREQALRWNATLPASLR